MPSLWKVATTKPPLQLSAGARFQFERRWSFATAAKASGSDRFSVLNAGDPVPMTPGVLAAHVKAREAIRAARSDLPIGMSLAIPDNVAVGADSGIARKQARLYEPFFKVAEKDACLCGRFTSGALTSPWDFERGGEIFRIEPQGPLIASVAGAADPLVDVAVAGSGVVSLFQDWLRPFIDAGSLEPVLPEWWQSFSGPFLYYSGRRLVPSPLRAFLDFIRT